MILMSSGVIYSLNFLKKVPQLNSFSNDLTIFAIKILSRENVQGSYVRVSYKRYLILTVIYIYLLFQTDLGIGATFYCRDYYKRYRPNNPMIIDTVRDNSLAYQLGLR